MQGKWWTQKKIRRDFKIFPGCFSDTVFRHLYTGGFVRYFCLVLGEMPCTIIKNWFLTIPDWNLIYEHTV